MQIQNGFYKRFKEEQLADGAVTTAVRFTAAAHGKVHLTFGCGDKDCTAVLSAAEARHLALELLRHENSINECERGLLVKKVERLEHALAE